MTHGFRRSLHRFVLFLAAATLGAVGLTAYDAKPIPSSANASIPTTVPNPKTPKPASLTPPPGKLRGVTNAMRWEAARRTSSRKSHARGKGQVVSPQNGVKQ
jgi:hypothetical protein